MRGITVLSDEHAIVPFEIVEDDDDLSIVSVHIHGNGFEMVKHFSGAVGTVEEMRVAAFIIFQT